MRSRLVLLKAHWTLTRHIERRSRLVRDSQVVHRQVHVPIGATHAPALLSQPSQASGWVIWPQSRLVEPVPDSVDRLHRAGLATLQLALPAPNREDLEADVERLIAAARWLRLQPERGRLPVGYLGLAERAPAVLWAASQLGPSIAAVVAAGGRYEALAPRRLGGLAAPTRLIVAEGDLVGLVSAREALGWLARPGQLVLAPGTAERWASTGLTGPLADLTSEWLLRWLLAQDNARQVALARRSTLLWRLPVAALMLSLGPLVTALASERVVVGDHAAVAQPIRRPAVTAARHARPDAVWSLNVFGSVLELSTLNGSTGFVANGIDVDDRSGFSVSNAGDVNGDGFDDVIIGAHEADPNAKSRAGESYVVFGKSSFGSVIELSSLNGSTGFVLNGIDVDDRSGYSVSGAGDVNGDGFDDLIIGAFEADPNAKGRAGESYVVFGRTSFGSVLELSSLNGSTGFVAIGIDLGDHSGRSVSGAGDANGDGLDDVIIGAYFAHPGGKIDAGESYVVFGMPPATPTPTPTNTPTITPTNTPTATTPAPPPLAIELADFHATRRGHTVLLDWHTLSEIKNAGFNLYRAPRIDGPLEPVNAQLIPARGSLVQGARYRFEDQPGRGRSYYWLEDVDTRGHTTRHGPVLAPPAQVRPIELPPGAPPVRR